MAGFTEGRLVISESTLYPTADGFWPMGAYGDFYGRLAMADEVAVDHNQEVWAAWEAVSEEDLPLGQGGDCQQWIGVLWRVCLDVAWLAAGTEFG